MEKKIVALNSGGFDSIVMLNRLKEQFPDNPIVCLFFDYGQKTVDEERRCAKKWVDSHSLAELKEIKIEMPVSVEMGVEEQYIPSRNLIFLSYAASFTESLENATGEIYMAITDPEKPENDLYFDETDRFISMYNALIEPLGIRVITPLAHLTKWQLYHDIWKYNIKREDFHSCNVSTELCGCGKCGDCKVIDSMYDMKRRVQPTLHYLKHGIDDELIQYLHDLSINSARLIINDEPQFYCNNWTQDKVTVELLTADEWINIIDDCIEHGIKKFDLSVGGLPYDDRFIVILDHLYSLGLSNTTMLATNGIVVPKYIDAILKYKPNMAIKVESSSDAYTRSVTVKDKVFRMLVDNSMPVQALIDLTSLNKGQLIDVIDHLYRIGVRDFYVNPITPCTEYTEGISNNIVLTAKEVMDCIDRMNTLNRFEDYKDIKLSIMLKMYHAKAMIKECPERFNRMMYVYSMYRTGCVGNTYIDFKFIGAGYENTIVIAPDGRSVFDIGQYM